MVFIFEIEAHADYCVEQAEDDAGSAPDTQTHATGSIEKFLTPEEALVLRYEMAARRRKVPGKTPTSFIPSRLMDELSRDLQQQCVVRSTTQAVLRNDPVDPKRAPVSSHSQAN